MVKTYKLLKQKVITIKWGRAWREESNILNDLILKRNKLSSDPIYDSLFQYKAQTYFLNLFEKMILWTISLFGFFLLIFRYLFWNKKVRISPIKYDVAFFYSESIFSRDVKAEKSLILIENNQGELSFSDLGFLVKVLFKTRFNFGLLSIAVYRIAQIRYAINAYQVTNIWANMEYSSASGIVKKYCNKKGILFANFMHGEKVLALREAFCSFDVIYVWNTHYKLIFEQLQCKARIEISNPWIECEIGSNLNKKNICYILKGFETDAEISALKIIFSNLDDLGYQVMLKDHPRQNNTSNKLSEYKIVDNNKDIFNLFSEFEYVMAQFSTVLFQAWCCRTKVILDDVSNPDLTKALKDRNYIFSALNEGVTPLSKFTR